MSALILFMIEMVGTVAFAFSGALVAIERKLDLLGIIVLGELTAIGGGILRDLILGKTPPGTFRKPIYAEVALLTCLLVFAAIRCNRELLTKAKKQAFDFIMNLCDAVGLGAFTVVGMNTAITAGFGDNVFLTVLMGVMTGVGGGLLRDICSLRVPVILSKHVYACASLLGALVYLLCYEQLPNGFSMLAAMASVVLIRMLASKYKWNLPRAVD